MGGNIRNKKTSSTSFKEFIPQDEGREDHTPSDQKWIMTISVSSGCKIPSLLLPNQATPLPIIALMRAYVIPAISGITPQQVQSPSAATAFYIIVQRCKV
uniref:Piwi domain-containing protein n=1 Tax=Steinernema glaseri TaxID=37863 RepID=A0A1I7ZW73_9BILA